jgi:hypothetical protein
MFSGGDYHEVARWLWNFLVSHAKREDPRIEVSLDTGREREGQSYAATLTLGERRASPMELDFREVAARRGDLAWCRALAERTRALARQSLLTPSLHDAHRR